MIAWLLVILFGILAVWFYLEWGRANFLNHEALNLLKQQEQTITALLQQLEERK